MRAAYILSAVAALAITGTAAEAKRLPPEEQIAKAIAGRVEGKPVNCLQTTQIRSSQIIDRTAILYTTNDGTIYVQRPSGKEFLDSNDILVSEPRNGQTCSIDIVRLIDQGSRMQSGSIGLNEFVPYKKVKTAG
ncbi:hypothetical protein [Sphingomonas immobilis]|uniref:Uncharacterized protein n=1 Tax=Sphingomonas immobilis TaxID=3063997 RepID=A0ABT8ZZ19_9SPHN|nr:hypothetical protein [Sphingomonas sp. CA1-15]MDO7842835.1 hypothetical protein [Sphingomonas sp. CA1-15]